MVSATISYNPGSFTATLTPSAPLAGVSTYTAVVKSGPLGVLDRSGNQLLSDKTWTFTTVNSLQVVSVSPAAGAINIPLLVTPSATFSEALDPSTVNQNTVLLTGPTGAQIFATKIFYSPTAFKIIFEPQEFVPPLQNGQTYTMTLKGGSNVFRITSAAGTPLPADYSWSFTLQPAPPTIQNYTIFTPDQAPSNFVTNIPSGVELGLKFHSDKSGIITGIRIFGSLGNESSTGKLWDSSGNLLAQVLVENDNTIWAQSNLDKPVFIQANTTYTVSYDVSQGGSYPADDGYFASKGVDNGPLHAPISSDVGGNGVMGTLGAFPDQASNATNYWVDVVFSDTGNLPPQVFEKTVAFSIIPETIYAPQTTFTKPLDPASVNNSTVMLIDEASNVVPSTITYDATTLTVTITPNREFLHFGEVYTVVLKGGPDTPHITDLSGTPLTYDYTWFFNTADPPTNPQPLLLLTSASSGNPFTKYCGEILTAEGFNYSAYDIAEATPQSLAQHNVVILGEMTLLPEDITLLSNWVAAGGNLIAMRPDKGLALILGINDASAVLSDAYLQIDTSREPGAGIVGETIQYHGAADLYTAAGDTQTVATLYSNATDGTSNPAVTLRSVGTNGGHTSAFTFDLGRSIVYSRQGNPAWAGQDRDGVPPIRTNDLFFGGSAPDWVNLNKAAIPQADELQRLFTNLILAMSENKSPIPRLWYLPNMLKAAIMMTGDDGTTNGTQTVFDMLNAASPQGCSVDNWECYRATSFVNPASGLTNDQATNYFNLGFDLAPQVDTGCQNWTPDTLSTFIVNSQNAFRAKYLSFPNPRSNRTNCTVWTDWATEAKAEFSRDILLDANYFYYPAQWVQNRPGFMTGSGIPMFFYDLDGSQINVYQAATHLTNLTDNTSNGVNSMLDKALGPEGYFGVFGVSYDFTDQYPATVLASAQAHNVPLISATQLLTWLVAKRETIFESQTVTQTASGSTLKFSILSPPVGAYLMVPYLALGGQVTSIQKVQSMFPVDFTVETIKGRSYAVFPATSDATIDYTVTYGQP